MSSRDSSPSRDFGPLASGRLNPPIIIRRGPRGFGFTLKVIKVYFGESMIYTFHHQVAVSHASMPSGFFVFFFGRHCYIVCIVL